MSGRSLRHHVGDSQVFCEHQKMAESKQIAEDIERFKAAGGAIEVLGMTTFPPMLKVRSRGGAKKKADAAFARKQKAEVISLEEADEEEAAA